MLVLGRFQGGRGTLQTTPSTGKEGQSPHVREHLSIAAALMGERESVLVPSKGEKVSLSFPAPQAAGYGQFASLVPLCLGST